MPRCPGLRVAPSSIHGYGVFAERVFLPDELITEVEGVLHRNDEVADDRYCLWFDDDHLFDMVDQTRWINHSCDPNVYIERAWVDGDPQVVMRAWRRIEVGDELATHYAFPRELAEPCSCGARECPGWILDPSDPRGPDFDPDERLAAQVTRVQHHPNVAWRLVDAVGRGVFARRPLARGATIEVAPITATATLACGHLPLYNHSDAPNMQLVPGPIPGTVAAVALTDIPRDAEIRRDHHAALPILAPLPAPQPSSPAPRLDHRS